ncbi:MAG: CRTAC1 family protein [Phycisphaerales bacterium]
MDATASTGLANINAARLCLADVNGDGRPDAMVRALEPGKPDRFRIFLNRVKEDGACQFTEVEHTNLPAPLAGDCLVFADIDNDGHADAVFTRSLDINNEKFAEPPAPSRTCWLKGNGDGTFQPPQIIDAAQRATTACIAVGDLDADGWLDLYLGNWYTKYGETNEAFTNDLLLQSWEHRGEYADPAMARLPKAQRRARERQPSDTVIFHRQPLPEDHSTFAEDTDTAGRPTYGALMAQLAGTPADRSVPAGPSAPQVLELNYGRRANRLWLGTLQAKSPQPPPTADEIAMEWTFADAAPSLGLDGDADRSGKYPDWLKERAKTDKRFEREDEKPYRSNGNHFDASVNDIDNDGDFDIFLAMITHAWAGPSSDRSRFLLNTDGHFVYNPRLSVDRAPADPTIRNWNQGDLFCQLEDFDNDGRVDLLLASSDYPDNQRTRIFRQQDNGAFFNITPYCGINNEGSGQISVGDVDLDGDLDILVGQSFNRLDAAQIAGRSPTVKVYLNQTVEKRAERIRNQLEVRGVTANSLTLKLLGDPDRGCSRDALGAIVRVTADLDGDPATPPVTQSRQLIGIGGHAGKQMEFLVHVGLGAAARADHVEVTWPARSPATTLDNVEAGRHEVRQ